MDYYSSNDIMKIAVEWMGLEEKKTSWMRQPIPRNTKLLCTHLKLVICCNVNGNCAIIYSRREARQQGRNAQGLLLEFPCSRK